MDEGVGRQRGWTGRGPVRLLGPLVLFLAIVLFPGGFEPSCIGADGSAYFALNYLSQSGHRFGPDVVCVYGPLGFLLWPQDLGHNLIFGIIFRLAFLALLLSLMVTLVVRRSRAPPTLTQVGVFALAYSTAVALGLPDEYQLLLVVLMLALVTQRAGRYAVVWGAVLGLVVGILVFVKLNLALGALGILLISAACGLLFPRRRRLWVVVAETAGFALTVLGLGPLLCGSLANLRQWVRGSMEVLCGFSGAMPSIMPSEPLLLTGITLALFLTLVVRLRSMGTAPMLLLGFLLFYGFKHAYVGHFDGYFPFVAALAGVPVLLVAGREEVRVAVAGWALLLVLCLPACVYYHHLTPRDISSVLSGRRGAERFLDLVRFDDLRLRLAVESSRALDRHRLAPATCRKLTEGGATVSVLPVGLSYIAANGLRWSPMPTLQSYGAYTACLDSLCAAYFCGSRRPDFLIVESQYVQRRNMVQDSPALWRAVRRWYDLDGRVRDGEALLLRARSQGREETMRVLGEGSARSQDWIDVPRTDRRLYLSLRMSVRPVGCVVGTLLNIPPLFVEIELEDGRRLSRQLVIDSARNGILLYPVVEDLEDLEGYLDGRPGRRAKRLRIVGEGVVYFRREVRLRWIEGVEPAGPSGDGRGPILGAEPLDSPPFPP